MREAISAVNNQTASGASGGECAAGDGASDTITLPRGNYRLELLPVGEDDNAGGDLDILASVILVGDGSKTVIENRIGSKGVLGDGDRLIHVDPTDSGLVDTEFRGISFRSGDAGCDGENCIPGAGGIHAPTSGALVIDNCVFQGNLSSCTGDFCGESLEGYVTSAAALVHGPLGDLTISNSLFTRNIASCSGIDCDTGSAAILKADNEFTGSALTTITDTVIQSNRALCQATECDIDDVVDLTSATINVARVQLLKNIVSCEGIECTSGETLDVDTQTADVETLLMVSNKLECEGAGCEVDEQLNVTALTIDIDNLLLKSNKTRCTGSFCLASPIAEIDADTLDGAAFTATGNRGECRGDFCVTAPLFVFYGDDSLELIRSNFTANKSACKGSACQLYGIIETYSALSSMFNQSTIKANKTACKGDVCETDSAIAILGEGVASVDDLLVTSNKCSCKALTCGFVPIACGIANYADDLTISGSTVTTNKTDGPGGGVGHLGLTMQILDTDISKNAAAFEGGGLIVEEDSVVTLIDGSTISRNKSGTAGGGIANFGTIDAITNTTIGNNSPSDCENLDLGVGCL